MCVPATNKVQVEIHLEFSIENLIEVMRSIWHAAKNPKHLKCYSSMRMEMSYVSHTPQNQKTI